MNKPLLTFVVVGAFALAPLAAHATIIFDGDPGPALPGQEEVVQFESGALTPGLVQIGDSNRTNTPVQFDTNFTAGVGSLGGDGTNQFIVTQGIGHSNLVCDPTGPTPCLADNTGGANGAQLTSMEIKPFNTNTAFGDLLANLDFGEGTANIYVKDNMGNNFSFALGNGQNKFSLTGTLGEVITDVQITMTTPSPSGFNELKEVDISGACTITAPGTCQPIPPVPEPTSVAVLGVGLLGLGFAYRRRRS
jgi:hypothetical protein